MSEIQKHQVQRLVILFKDGIMNDETAITPRGGSKHDSTEYSHRVEA